jgi:hypothetical protein
VLASLLLLESPDFPNVFCAAVDHAVADVLTVPFDVAAFDIPLASATAVVRGIADVIVALCFP